MSLRSLSKEQKQQLIELGLSKISNQLNMTWDEIAEEFSAVCNNLTGEKVRGLVNRERYKTGSIQGKYSSDKESILIMSDLHIPDHDEEEILKAVRDNKHCSMIILGGDILDCKAVSSFSDEGISLLDLELIAGHQLITKIKEINPNCKIILVKGNHEQRCNSFFAKNAKLMGSALVETEILYKLCNGFEVYNRNTKTRTIYPPLENVFYSGGRTFEYGDLLVNHPSTFSKIPLKTVTTMYENRLKYKYPNARVFMQGHTHQAGICFRDYNVVLCETGCMTFNHSYAENDDKPYSSQQLAYVTLDMKDKSVITSTIKLHHLGATKDKYPINKLEL